MTSQEWKRTESVVNKEGRGATNERKKATRPPPNLKPKRGQFSPTGICNFPPPPLTFPPSSALSELLTALPFPKRKIASFLSSTASAVDLRKVPEFPVRRVERDQGVGELGEGKVAREEEGEKAGGANEEWGTAMHSTAIAENFMRSVREKCQGKGKDRMLSLQCTSSRFTSEAGFWITENEEMCFACVRGVVCCSARKIY